ncbi:MAG: helix-turn-helix domain-containing protein [Chloroflexi bacterium]|nr:helix-turn-helix domain-containing protein [Chloroflexota bacterium]
MIGDRWFSVAEAARRLAVSQSRVRSMLRTGILEGEKLDGRWLVDPASVDRRRASGAPVGRCLSALNSWAVLFLAAGETARATKLMEHLHPWTRSRIRSSLDNGSIGTLAPRLRRRATVRRFRSHPSDLAGILLEPRVLRAGVSAAPDYDLDIVASGIIEVYIPASRLRRLSNKYRLQPSLNPNVTLHVVEGVWPFPSSAKIVPAAVAALDLVEADDERTRRAGRQLLDRLGSH